MVYLYEYMSKDEYAAEIERVKNENFIASINKDHFIIEMEHEAAMRDIELKVLMENYTEDDLTAMYMQEMKVFTEAADGIIHKFIEYVKNIIKAIFNIKPETKPVEDTDEITIPINPHEGNNLLNKVSEAIKSLASIKDETDEDKAKAKTKAAEIIGGIGIAGALTAFLTPTKIKGKLIENLSKITDDLTSKVNGFIDKCKEIKSAAANAEIRGPIGKIVEALKAAKEALMKFFGGKSKDDEEGKDASDENKDDNGSGEDNGKGSSDDAKKMKKLKKTVKSQMLSQLRNAKDNEYMKNVKHDESEGNKLNREQMHAIANAYRKMVQNGKVGEDPAMLKNWNRVLKWMDANNINEYALENDELDEMITMLESVDDVILERELMGIGYMDEENFEMTLESFLASHPDPMSKSDEDELRELADLL